MLYGIIDSAVATALALSGPVVLSITPAGNAGNNAAPTTGKLVDMPDTDAGDLLIMELAIDDDAAVVVSPVGWVEGAYPHVPLTLAGKVYTKIASGLEGGTVVGLTLDANKYLAGHTYRIAAGTFDPDYPPEFTLSPSWGFANNLYIRGGVTDRNPTVTGYPYSSGQTYTSSGGADASACGAYSCWKVIASASEDSAPEDFTFGSTAFSLQLPLAIVIPPPDLGLFAQYSYPDGILGGDPINSSAPVVWRGTGPYVFSIEAGSLPPGLELDAPSGIISGNPTDDGTYPFTIRCTDSGALTFDAELSIEIALQALEVVGDYGDTGTVSDDFYALPTFRYGRPPYAFTVHSGAIPPGLTLDPDVGQLYGFPTAEGSYTFTVRCVDDDGDHVDLAGAIAIDYQPLQIDGEYGDGVQGEDYDDTAYFHRGRMPYAFALHAGSLPPGLALNAGTGEIFGNPTTPGTYSFTIRCTDTDSNFADIADDIEITA